jgi:hypothetical protein
LADLQLRPVKLSSLHHNPTWWYMQRSVPAIGFTSTDHRQPGSYVIRPRGDTRVSAGSVNRLR